jgi:hypothetical protein
VWLLITAWMLLLVSRAPKTSACGLASSRPESLGGDGQPILHGVVTVVGTRRPVAALTDPCGSWPASSAAHRNGV